MSLKEKNSFFVVLQYFMHLVLQPDGLYFLLNLTILLKDLTSTVVMHYVLIVETNIDSQTQYLLLLWGNVVVWYIEMPQCCIIIVHTSLARGK